MKNVFSLAPNLQDRKSKPPLPIIISFRCPDIAIGPTKNFCDDMSRSRLSKRPRNTNHKRFVSEDTETSQDAEYFLNQFFHAIVEK